MFASRGLPLVSAAVLVTLLVIGTANAAPALSDSSPPSFGTPATPAQIAGWNIDVEPDGPGLPPGSGTPAAGAALYLAKCAACHGPEGEGLPVPGRGPYPRLIGGIGTLASEHPVKTVGSFWPYATILFDYIRRAMPFDAPGSLSNDEVYALSAFILDNNGIIPNNAVMDAKTLSAVKMPNRNGFYTRPEPETNNLSPYLPRDR
jgi:S-disulfanyl-L-cysteine oxidoreductase SoxD